MVVKRALTWTNYIIYIDIHTLYSFIIINPFKFQTQKQKIAVKEKHDNELKERLSLSIPLVDEVEEDIKIAKLLSYQTSDSKDSFYLCSFFVVLMFKF